MSSSGNLASNNASAFLSGSRSNLATKSVAGAGLGGNLHKIDEAGRIVKLAPGSSATNIHINTDINIVS